MKTIRKKADAEYLRFFHGYCATLCGISNDEWDYHDTGASVDKTFDKYFRDFRKGKYDAERYEDLEYLVIEKSGCFVPPGCEWISRSGSFSCHSLHAFTGGQGYILWHLERREVLPLIFHDLSGMDEEEGIIFGRTMSPIHREGYASPMRIDPEWLSVVDFCLSVPDLYDEEGNLPLSDEDLFDMSRKGIIATPVIKDIHEAIIEWNGEDHSVPVLEELQSLAVFYKDIKREFAKRQRSLKASFNLSPEQEREVDYGIIIPADRSLQKYVDILNGDKHLNLTHIHLKKTIIKGCLEIFNEIRSRDIEIMGYDLEAFINDPYAHEEEIFDLMQGFGGYQHILTIRGKIALEIPAREHLRNRDRSLIRNIDFWLKTVEEFSLD